MKTVALFALAFLFCAPAARSSEPVFYFNDENESLIYVATDDPNRLLMPDDIDDSFNTTFTRPAGSPPDTPFVNPHGFELQLKDDMAVMIKKGKVTYRGYRLDSQPDFSNTRTRYYRLENGQGVYVDTVCPYICFMRARFEKGPTVYHANYQAPPGVDEAYGFINGSHYWFTGSELSIWRGTNFIARSVRAPPPNASVPNTNPCPPLAIAPLPTNATPLSTAAWEDMSRKLYRRHLLAEGYLQGGHRDPAWDEDAIALIDGFIAYYVNPWQGMKNDQQRLALSQSILDRGCRDPSVRFVHAVNLNMNGRTGEAKQILDELLPIFSAPDRPHAFMQFLTQYRCGHAGDHKMFLAAAETVLTRAASDGSYTPEELRRLLFYFTEHTYYTSYLYYHGDDSKLMEFVARNPALDPWFRETMLGHLHLSRAWSQTWVRNFDPSEYLDWDAYAADLAAARLHLENAIAINPAYPEPYRFLIKLARLAPTCNQEEARRWFDRAIACQFDFMPAYEEWIDAYRPANGGSIQQLFNLGLAFAQTRRYDTQVPDYIFRTLEEIGADTGNLHDILDAPGAAEALLDTASAYVDRNVFRTRNLTRAAVVCWFYGDFAGAGRFLSRIPFKTPINRRTLETFRTSEKEIAADVYLHTGLSSGRLDDQTAAEQVLRNRQFIAEVEKQLATGEWTPLMKTDSLDGWHVRYGALSLTTNQQAETQNTNRRFQLRGQMDLGDSYEIAVDFELVTPTNYTTWGAGLGTYNSPPPFGGAGLCNAEVVAAYRPGENDPSESLPPGATLFAGPEKIFPRAGRNTLLLRANGRQAEAYLNNQLIRTFQYRAIPGQKVYPHLFAPETYSRYDSAIVRYGNLRARRLAPSTRLDALPAPATIPNPIWVETGQQKDIPPPGTAAQTGAEAIHSTGETAKAPAPPTLTVQNLPEGSEPIWISILPPDHASPHWRAAWEAPIGPALAADGSPSTPTYTLMHTTDLTQPFTPMKTGITNNEIPLPTDAPSGFFHVVPETSPSPPAP